MLYASHMRAAGEAYRTKSFRLANFKKRSNQAIQPEIFSICYFMYTLTYVDMISHT